MIVRTHRHAAGAAKGARGRRCRSRGGLATKIHTLADGRGRSLVLLITPGRAAGVRQLVPLLDRVRVPRPDGSRPPRRRSQSLAGDKAYSPKANRKALRGKRITTVIPERNDQIANGKRKGLRGADRSTSTRSHKRRNQVERGFHGRQHWRGLPATTDRKSVV